MLVNVSKEMWYSNILNLSILWKQIIKFNLFIKKLLFIHSKISFYKQRIVGQKHVLFMFKQRKGMMILVDNNILLLTLLPHLRQLHRSVVERFLWDCVNLWVSLSKICIPLIQYGNMLLLFNIFQYIKIYSNIYHHRIYKYNQDLFYE